MIRSADRSPPLAFVAAPILSVAAALLLLGAACTESRTVATADTTPPTIAPIGDAGAWPNGSVTWPDTAVLPDTTPPDTTPPDTTPPDTTPLDVARPPAPDAGPWPAAYGHLSPPPGTVVPEGLRAERWVTHLQDDLLPYWTMPAALGDPVGNFPTYRRMDGAVRPPSERRPRMIARQTYAYAIGFLLTGDEALLGHARAGVDWLVGHAKDPERGGWYPLLDAAGAPLGTDPKTAQDTAYCMLGPAAYFFVTRDPGAEAELLATRDLLFDPDVWWDAANGRIRDALSWDMATEVDVEGDGGWELVAQLDPVNAFLLLVQPVLTDPTRRAQALGDLRALGDALVTHFLSDGVFWGVHTNRGRWGTKHVDFGHTLKAYWMLLQIDKRLADAPYRGRLAAGARTWSDLAYDASYGRWANRVDAWPAGGAPTLRYGSDWWIYAEADQLAMTLALLSGTPDPRLAQTTAHWIEDFVDDSATAREVIPSIQRDGSWGWSWSGSDDAKCNLWKNGYHSVEHALVAYLYGRWLADEPAALHFAVPAAAVDTFVATPYVFQGREISREDLGPVASGGETLRHVVVRFDDLY